MKKCDVFKDNRNASLQKQVLPNSLQFLNCTSFSSLWPSHPTRSLKIHQLKSSPSPKSCRYCWGSFNAVTYASSSIWKITGTWQIWSRMDVDGCIHQRRTRATRISGQKGDLRPFYAEQGHSIRMSSSRWPPFLFNYRRHKLEEYLETVSTFANAFLGFLHEYPCDCVVWVLSGFERPLCSLSDTMWWLVTVI